MKTKKNPKRMANHPILRGIRQEVHRREGDELELLVALYDGDKCQAVVELADPRIAFVKAYNELMAKTGSTLRAELGCIPYVMELELHAIRDW